MKIGIARTNFFINFVPVFLMFMGVLIMGDQFKLMNIISLSVIFTGLLVYLKEKEALQTVK